MASGRLEGADLERLGQLARDLADSDPGPAGELACALAEAVADISGRVDALWQLITAVVETAGLTIPEETSPPAEFAQALTSARSSGVRAVRLRISGKEWVAAVSQDHPPDDPARAWAALERVTEAADDQDDS
jgi:hypothetical protein